MTDNEWVNVRCTFECDVDTAQADVDPNVGVDLLAQTGAVLGARAHLSHLPLLAEVHH